MDNTHRIVRLREPSRFFLRVWFDALPRRFPMVGLVGAIFVSNLTGSFFSFFYNTLLIVQQLTEAQAAAFWNVAAPFYNVVAYPLGFGILIYVLWPMARCLRMMRHGTPIEPAFLERCQRRLINLPIVQLSVNFACVAPGAIYFPWVVTAMGGSEGAGAIWLQFFVSFMISAVFTTVQTFFLLQAYLTAYLYPEFFKETRPQSVAGSWRIPFTARLVMLWAAVALMPLVALLAVALNFASDRPNPQVLYWFGPGLLVVSAISGGGIFWIVGRDLWRWMNLQTEAMGQIARGNFDIHIDDPRPDEWGVLTDHFNDMAIALNRAWESHETLGQLVSPEVRDQILRRMHGFEVQLQEITVLFVDIRGFTRRSSGADPAKIGALLNRFLTLALQSIEEKGGYVNKFLGDGVMALYGATHPQADHADLALASACELVARVGMLNAELAQQGEMPLVIGIGIHTGQALVGCFGATIHGDKQRKLMRREFTAIGETVNLAQRMEQLTKKCGGPILLSDATRLRLQRQWVLTSVGPQEVPGAPEPIVVFKVEAG